MNKPKPELPAITSTSALTTLGPLVEQIRTVLDSARRSAVTHIQSLQVRTNYEVGRLIVEHEQNGRQRAAYGKEALTELAKRLTEEVGRGFSRQNLQHMRNFYLIYKDRDPQIRQTVSGESEPAEQFRLTWSHYVLLIGIADDDERRFYEIEAETNNWAIRELKRQVASALYERLALSRDQNKIRELSHEGQIIAQPADVLKDPYVLEFLGLESNPAYSENDLESAIISRLEHFLLELGKGFLFEARQKRFTFDEDHFFVDLVFYNRLLRCYVLIDLKLDKLTHQDLGQMQMYVNYFDRFVKTPEENPTVGIVLCKRKNDALVELTLPANANIFASAYQLYLPSKEDLRRQLLE